MRKEIRGNQKKIEFQELKKIGFEKYYYDTTGFGNIDVSVLNQLLANLQEKEMLKRLKSVSMMLFLMGASTGAAYAVASPGVTDLKITQQSGTCTGVVKDATGETVIGASVVVKGTTNGTITEWRCYSDFFRWLYHSRNEMEWNSAECYFER